MTLAVLGHQPYSEVRRMSQRELDTLHAVVKEINEAKGGKSVRRRG
jgi:phage FluMu protein gp41